MTKYASNFDKVNIRNFQSVWIAVHKRLGRPVDFSAGEQWYRALRLYDSISIYRELLRQIKLKRSISLIATINSLEVQRTARIYAPINESKFRE